jgi:hypothetical protein
VLLMQSCTAPTSDRHCSIRSRALTAGPPRSGRRSDGSPPSAFAISLAPVAQAAPIASPDGLGGRGGNACHGVVANARGTLTRAGYWPFCFTMNSSCPCLRSMQRKTHSQRHFRSTWASRRSCR